MLLKLQDQGILPGRLWQVSDQTERQAVAQFHPSLQNYQGQDSLAPTMFTEPPFNARQDNRPFPNKGLIFPGICPASNLNDSQEKIIL